MRVKTRDGEEVIGIQRAEDNYTLIMTDLNGQLRRFDRKDILAEQVETKSLMPDNYSQLLSPTEVQDLVAYLKSLKSRDLSKTIQVDLPGGLSFARLRNAAAEPQNWLTYWGDYQGHHYSALNQITPLNVPRLQAQWSVQMPPGPVLEATPLVVDGTMYTTYTTAASAGVYAIDARSGLTSGNMTGIKKRRIRIRSIPLTVVSQCSGIGSFSAPSTQHWSPWMRAADAFFGKPR